MRLKASFDAEAIGSVGASRVIRLNLDSMFRAQDLFKNYSYLTLSEIIARAATVFTLVYAARVLGPASFGMLAYSTMFVSYFLEIGNYGFHLWGLRETARRPSEAQSFLDIAFTARLFLSIAAYAGLVLLAHVVVRDDEKVFLCVILQGVAVLTTAFNQEWLFLAIEKARFLAVRKVFARFVPLIFLIAAVRSPDDIYYAAFSNSLFYILAAVLAGVGLYRYGYRFHIMNMPKRWHSIKGHLKASTIYFVMSVTVVIHYGIAIVVMKFYNISDEVIGYYSAAYSFVQMGLIPLTILSQTLFPRIRNTERSHVAFTKIFVIAGIFIMFYMLSCSYSLTRMLYGDHFLESGHLLTILAFQVALIGVSNGYGYLLHYEKREKDVFYVTLLLASCSTVLNLALGRLAGAYAPAVILVAAEFVGVVIFIFLHKRLMPDIYPVKKVIVLFAVCGISGSILSYFDAQTPSEHRVLIAVTTLIFVLLFYSLLLRMLRIVRIDMEVLRELFVRRRIRVLLERIAEV